MGHIRDRARTKSDNDCNNERGRIAGDQNGCDGHYPQRQLCAWINLLHDGFCKIKGFRCQVSGVSKPPISPAS